MANNDNTRLNPGQGGDIIATSERGSVNYQQVMVMFEPPSGSDIHERPLKVSEDQGFPVDLGIRFNNPAGDAFGRLRTSEASTLGDFMQVHGAHNNLVWTSGSIGSGSIVHDTDRSSTILTVHTGSGDERIWQTKRHFKYQPGLSHIAIMTGIVGAAKAGVRRRLGYFATSDGIFLQLSGSTLALVHRNSISGSVDDNVIDQVDWNLDSLDGSGSSSVALDISKIQTFCVDLQWMGGGRARAGFFIRGKIIYAHEFVHSNLISSPYLKTPNLPVRFEITNEAETASPTTLEQVCFSVLSEGSIEKEAGIVFSTNRGTTVASIGTSKTPLMSIRLQSGSEAATIADILTEIVAVTSTTFLWEAILNPIVSDAASWTAVPDSVVEFDIVRSGSITGGNVIASGYGIETGGGKIATATTPSILPLKSMLGFGSDLDGNRDELVIVVQNTAGSDNFLGSATWRELL